MASLSRRVPRADSSSEARYSMLATKPPSRPYWCTPTSRRAGPVAYGLVDTDVKVLIIAGSRNTRRAHRRTAPPDGVDRHHVGVDVVDVDQPVGSGGGMVDDDEPADVVDQLGHRPQSVTVPRVPDAEVTATSRVACPIRPFPLPGRQVAGFDVDLGPFHLGAEPVGSAQPGRDVRFVVEPGDDHLVAQTGARRRRVGQRSQQHRAVGAQHHAAGVGVHQIGRRLPRRFQHGRAALGRGMRTGGAGERSPEGGRNGGRHRVGDEHPGRGIEVHPTVPERRVQPAHSGDVVCHTSHLRAPHNKTNRDGSGRPDTSPPSRAGPPGQPY